MVHRCANCGHRLSKDGLHLNIGRGGSQGACAPSEECSVAIGFRTRAEEGVDNEGVYHRFGSTKYCHCKIPAK